MTEFLHEIVAKRDRQDLLNIEACERLVQWLVEQQREEDNVDNQSN
jgi:hypothetical protein